MISCGKLFSKVSEPNLAHFRLVPVKVLQGLAAVHDCLHFN